LERPSKPEAAKVEPYRDAHESPAATSGPYREEAAMPKPAPCPRCEHAALSESSECAECGGAFLGHAALADVITEERAKRDSAPFAPAPVRHARPGPVENDVRYLRCPECRQPMSRMNFGRRSGVILDACRKHGTWFDAGELERVRDFVRAGGLEGEEHATAPKSDPPALHGEAARMAKVAEGLMREEAMRQDRAIEETTDLVEDLLFFVFGAGASSSWRYTRRRR
jgi:Zn-finger nucleic acid-binding protein